MKNRILIGVIAGGLSSEREISLKTGKNINDSLLRSGYNTLFIDFMDIDTGKLKKIDRAFLALHGRYGEDGTVQGILELMKIPYTGSGVLSSAMVIDKILSKRIMRYEGLPTPDFTEVRSGKNMDSLKPDLKHISLIVRKEIGYPVVIKPNREGSTIGITKACNEEELYKGLEVAIKYDGRVLVEKFIKGREITVGIIGREPVPLPIVEIIPRNGFFSYECKYIKNMTEYIVPAVIEPDIGKSIIDMSLKSHKALCCNGISRVDLIIDENNDVHILEVNTMPGMTGTSLVPMAARAAGISFDLLVEIILDCTGLEN
ncbi:MAG: D-alanine--D-alanine ligase [Actinobacteria bacterium]|nr:D-alanine--D-alanine ligase [Actinomycetota bacterium]